MANPPRNHPMYRLAACDRWFNGMQFDSLAAAIAKAKRCDITCDVIAYVDAETWRAVWTNKKHSGFRPGTYRKHI